MIYYFTHRKASKLLALHKSLVITGDASIAFGIKEDGLDISADKFQHKNIKTLRSMLIYITAFLTKLKACYANTYIVDPRVTDIRSIRRDTSLLRTVFLVPPW